jgi:hypothetical protein
MRLLLHSMRLLELSRDQGGQAEADGELSRLRISIPDGGGPIRAIAIVRYRTLLKDNVGDRRPVARAI